MQIFLLTYFRRIEMKTLMIKDLSLTEEMDRKAMAAVQGGTYKGAHYVPSYSQNKSDLSFDATQLISQDQNVFNANGNNVAFLDKSKINSTVTSDQHANNNSIRIIFYLLLTNCLILPAAFLLGFHPLYFTFSYFQALTFFLVQKNKEQRTFPSEIMCDHLLTPILCSR
jgi:hypothetical protein